MDKILNTMTIGIFSDAHANEIGFFPCYNYLLEHADQIYYLGDSAGYFPLSNRIIDVLRTENIICLKGNHDAMITGELPYEKNNEEIYGVHKSMRIISPENLNFLRTLKSEIAIQTDGKHLLFVHGSPANPLNGYIYPDTDTSDLENLDYDAIFMAHTHRPFIKPIGGKNLVNVGSCGLPRDRGNVATMALYNTIKNEVKIKELELNTEEVLKRYATEIHPDVKSVLHRNHKKFDNE